ncbi:hypothetical protein P8631_11555 (plasmid) [Guyparkeria sp. 1SP6A2]|nr:hypothetical protein [Guyparkeria sp. 1SP6A2]
MTDNTRWYLKQDDIVLIFNAPNPDNATAVSVEFSTDLAEIRKTYAPLQLRAIDLDALADLPAGFRLVAGTAGEWWVSWPTAEGVAVSAAPFSTVGEAADAAWLRHRAGNRPARAQ